MKPVLALLGVCCSPGLLSSCSMVPANTEDLLEPPKLSPDQAAWQRRWSGGWALMISP